MSATMVNQVVRYHPVLSVP